MIRWTIPVLLLAACATSPSPAERVRGQAAEHSPPAVSIFTVAHEDDWQLFMMPDAFRAMDESQEKAVFSHLTAGDAGKGVTGDPVPYYVAREEGALRAIRFLANAGDKPGLGSEMRVTEQMVAGHRLHRVSYANAVIYFLRLPDGFGQGPGYETTGFQSLQRFMEGKIATMSAVDASATYAGWSDLQETLAGIITAELVGGSQLSIRVTEPEASLNPIEHSDHRHTARAMLAVAEHFPCAAVLRYDTYDNRNRPMNLTGADLLMHAGIWGATTSGLGDNFAPSTWEPGHFNWLGRMYVREARAKEQCVAAPAK
ncbi:MAG: hypothetical protein ABMA14_22295 [Hyphomonadaceae bacterium]